MAEISNSSPTTALAGRRPRRTAGATSRTGMRPTTGAAGAGADGEEAVGESADGAEAGAGAEVAAEPSAEPGLEPGVDPGVELDIELVCAGAAPGVAPGADVPGPGGPALVVPAGPVVPGEPVVGVADVWCVAGMTAPVRCEREWAAGGCGVWCGACGTYRRSLPTLFG
ncbi:hypothetical protein [Streptomyces sp. NRRL F-6676]|uniref:hypothetical protein n=1 Tax=Streptomyces sp. NRRL F-6676 TaxID=1463878 RepID=UPI000AF7B0EE|nr:hypothetical protein [Streptomyces sp. NRRL F-6676]